MISGPIMWRTIDLPHAGTGGSAAAFALSMGYDPAADSAYVPRWDYDGVTIDIGNAPPARALGTVPTSTSIKLSFCPWAQQDIDVSDIGMDQAGVSALLGDLATQSNPADINYEQQDLYVNFDSINTSLADWTTMAGAGWTRTGVYAGGRIVYDINVGAGVTHTLPILAGTYNYQVDWGDGSPIEQYNFNATPPSHVYVGAGTYTITLLGSSITRFAFDNVGDKLHVVSTADFDFSKIGCITASGLWHGCSNLVSSNTTSWNTSVVVSFGTTWTNCTSLTLPPDSSGWDTSSVTTFQSTWSGCTALTLPPDTSGWDTSSVTTFQNTWNGCSSMTLPPVTTGWITSSVTTFQNTWNGCNAMTAPPDSSGWDTSSVTTFQNTWRNCNAITLPPDSSGWDTSAVNNFSFTWSDCNSMTAPPITTSWDTSAVTAFEETFSNTGLIIGLGTELPNLNYTAATTTENMLISGEALTNADIDAWVIQLDTEVVPLGFIFDYAPITGGAHLDAGRSAPAANAPGGAIDNLITNGAIRLGVY